MILVALGANLPGAFGTPERALVSAMDEMQRAGLTIVACSRIWLTAPVPASDQPDYRNAVIRIETDLPSAALLNLLHRIEADFGRVRSVRNEARVIDLDLLAYGDEIIDNDDITLPHPRMHDRAFVLVPLCEIVPEWVHPVLNKPASVLLDNLDDKSSLATMKVAA